MPFGLGKDKKDKDGDLEAKKSSLFGGRSKGKSSSPAPASSNPYAVPPAGSDPYAKSSGNPYANQSNNDPYAKSASSLTQPPTSSFGSLSISGDKGAPPPAYASSCNGPAPNR